MVATETETHTVSKRAVLSCFLIPSSCLVALKENVNDSLLETVVKVFSCQGLVQRERGPLSLCGSLSSHIGCGTYSPCGVCSS